MDDDECDELALFCVLCAGTITPHGADVWSYAPDEDSLVKVPRLGEYLSHWGIDIMRLEKTDKTLAEQEVELNKSYNWSKVLESGASLQLVSAPGCIGLTNIGSSCYMNAVLQVIFSIPEVPLVSPSRFSSPYLIL